MSNSLPVAHACKCARTVSEPTATEGIALWSSLAVVTARMTERFPLRSRGVVSCTGPQWISEVSTFLDSLNRAERQSVQGVALTDGMEVDPWLARPADEVLCRYRASWLPELLNATAEGRPGGLMAYFQPIVDLRRGKVFAFEALMRAEIDGRLVAAGEIIDAARAHQATFQFDRLARIAAIRQGAEQIQSGEKLFINFSPSVIYDPAVCLRTTWEVADEVGFDPTSLVFEVVESEAFPDISHLRRILDAYRDKGAQMALDDLGSGHTALHYIDSLRPDLIKLDRNLLPTDPERTNLSLLRGLVDYAHSHGIRVLAEGVETEAQKEIVTGLKMDYAQGWYFGRPAGEMVRRMPVPTANAAVPVGQH